MKSPAVSAVGPPGPAALLFIPDSRRPPAIPFIRGLSPPRQPAGKVSLPYLTGATEKAGKPSRAVARSKAMSTAKGGTMADEEVAHTDPVVAAAIERGLALEVIQEIEQRIAGRSCGECT